MNWKPLKSSRRFITDKWHPYGWQISWKMTFRADNGETKRIYQSALGTDRHAAKANASHTGLYLLK